MTLPAQLRTIADRLEAADAEKVAALAELWQIRTVDSAAVQVAAEEQKSGDGTVGRDAILPAGPSPAAPIQQAGPPGGVSAGSSGSKLPGGIGGPGS